MDSVSFKNALAEAKPEIEDLLDAGLSRDEAADLTSSFEISPRPAAENFDIPDSTLKALFSGNDISRVEIGMVRFHGHPEKVPGGWIIGEVEADYLMLNRISGEILVMDITSPDHVIWRCAKDGAGFLGAIAVAAKYLGACISGDQSGTSYQRDALRDCTNLAGGDEYSAFYKMLIGFE